jgi:hypothetical protein
MTPAKQSKILIALLLLLPFLFCSTGCGGVGSHVLKFVKQSVSKGGKTAGGKVKAFGPTDTSTKPPVTSNSGWWKTPGVLGGGQLRTEATQTLKLARQTTERCGRRLGELERAMANRRGGWFEQYPGVAEATYRVLHHAYQKNSEKVAEIEAKLADLASLSDREVKRLYDELRNINISNERIEAKIEDLTNQLG